GFEISAAQKFQNRGYFRGTVFLSLNNKNLSYALYAGKSSNTQQGNNSSFPESATTDWLLH
ncbi:hypothetical protein, partial [Victivallis vadensis]|uniref:hypothetical protein n=1 Tax=Victivallis vadensis TaxID=172901 RepID=UPI002673187F